MLKIKKSAIDPIILNMILDRNGFLPKTVAINMMAMG